MNYFELNPPAKQWSIETTNTEVLRFTSKQVTFRTATPSICTSMPPSTYWVYANVIVGRTYSHPS